MCLQAAIRKRGLEFRIANFELRTYLGLRFGIARLILKCGILKSEIHNPSSLSWNFELRLRSNLFGFEAVGCSTHY